MSHQQVFAGQLQLDSNGEEDDILFLNGEPLAEQIEEAMGQYGRFLSVRYWLTDVKMDKDQLQDALVRQMEGEANAQYEMRYSEITGYLWTTEELEVGGHDLLKELKPAAEKWLYLDITFNLVGGPLSLIWIINKRLLQAASVSAFEHGRGWEVPGDPRTVYIMGYSCWREHIDVLRALRDHVQGQRKELMQQVATLDGHLRRIEQEMRGL